MSLDSYKMSRRYSYSDPRKEMMRRKEIQINRLYDMAMDREDDALLNGQPFKKSPRIFDEKNRDSFHYRVIVETIDKEDWFSPGDYLQLNNETWLCIEVKNFHGLYCKGTFQKCNWLLKWQDKYTRKVHEYWCFDENSTQYNSGEANNKSMVFRMGSAQHILMLPCDENTILIESPQRFFLDRNPINPTPYKVSQNDNSPYAYGKKGLCIITVVQDQINRATDRIDLGICDYIEDECTNDTHFSLVSDIISAEGFSIKSGGSARTLEPLFLNNNSEDTAATPVWEIDCEFKEKLSINETGNTIRISIDDDHFVGYSFFINLQDKQKKYPKCQKEISIVSLYS